MSPIVVFDTNILISALLSLRGHPFRCLALAKLGVIQSVTCRDILDEFVEKLEGKFRYPPERARAAADEVRDYSRLVAITHTLNIVATDPDDDKVVECALVGGASHIATGDRRHLLPLRNYQGIEIISAAGLLPLVLASS